jgi:hypothetical protein
MMTITAMVPFQVAQPTSFGKNQYEQFSKAARKAARFSNIGSDPGSFTPPRAGRPLIKRPTRRRHYNPAAHRPTPLTPAERRAQALRETSI